MVVSMETRKIPEKLRQEFSEIDKFGTQISYSGQPFRVKKCNAITIMNNE